MTLDPFPKREYGPADFEPIYEAKPYSFELNEDWLSLMAKEFDMEKAAADFARAIMGKSKDEVETTGKEFFEKYGTALMRRCLQLGEEYMDRTYEVLKAACDKTGGYLTWPLIPQRFIEAAVLGIQDALVLPMIQNNHDCLQFRVEDCKMYIALKEKCGQEVAMGPISGKNLLASVSDPDMMKNMPADKVAERLIGQHPALVICGTNAGSYAMEQEAAIARHIRRARADVLLVAYPSVPQEKWIARNLVKTGAAVGMGVGAAFDFVAGVQVRAPPWMQRAGIEWLYRLMREPRRWHRMLALPQAAWLVFWQRLCSKINQIG